MSKFIGAEFKKAAAWVVIYQKSSAEVAVRVLPRGPGELALKTKRRVRPSPLPVRMSEVEKEIVRGKAQSVGCTVNAYAKEALLKWFYKPPRNLQLTRALLALNRELTPQGNNLNQIPKLKLHSKWKSISEGHLMLCNKTEFWRCG